MFSSAVSASLTKGKTAKQWRKIFWPEDYAIEGHDIKI